MKLKTDRRDYLQQVVGGSSYASTSWDELTFGIPQNERTESITIRWPGQGQEWTHTFGPHVRHSQLTIIQPASAEDPLQTFLQSK